mmetsp:Transcript_27464/g.63558  ORF Transcript_27464/g.63558 Transcript_27464/m.63558 type:complete len:529 (+) Transcript_27464:508-2094(+)
MEASSFLSKRARRTELVPVSSSCSVASGKFWNVSSSMSCCWTTTVMLTHWGLELSSSNESVLTKSASSVAASVAASALFLFLADQSEEKDHLLLLFEAESVVWLSSSSFLVVSGVMRFSTRCKSSSSSSDDDDDEEEEPVDVTDTKNVSSTETTGGHLRERAQQLDWRTYRMIQNRYLEFCDVRRQGSFLPQKLSSQHQIEWEEAQHHNNATTGTKRGHGWATLSFSEVRFLHWMGVSPYATADDGSNNNNNNGDDSATTAKQKQQQLDAHHQSNLSPPDPSTTHALAFLAHDFFGRIVEKAIAVHKERQKQEGANNRDTAAAKKKTKDPSQEGSDDGIQELQEHEQLTEQDVKQALEHPELQPTSLFAHHGDQKNSNSQSASSLAQLYFGPGFEDRVEMEMEELLLQHTAEHERHDNNKAGNDEEQRRWRQKEDELFDQLVQKAPGTEQDLVQLEQQQQQQPSTTTRKENKSKSKRSSPGTTGKKSTNEPKKKRRVAFSPKTKESPQDTAVTKPARKPRTRSARTKK